MASTIDIFNSAKLDFTNYTGSNNFFSSVSEITESSNLQNKFLSDVDYSNAANFARFGLAEEYYKNAINYINDEYPYDGSKLEKLKWLNSLNEFEYYLFTNEYPKYSGYLFLSGTNRYLGAYSPSKDTLETSSMQIFVDGNKYYVNKTLNYNDGFSFEAWMNFSGSASQSNIFTINTILSSSGGLYNSPYAKIYKTSNNFYLSSSKGVNNFNKQIDLNNWHHYVFNVDKNSCSLFVDGELNEQFSSSVVFNSSDVFNYYKIGLLTQSVSVSQTGSYNKDYSFLLCSASNFYIDEAKYWSKTRTIEDIGRFWFTDVNGNDVNDSKANNLIFYYKFDEGFDPNYGYLVLDYSGYKNNGFITNYTASCRITGSAINSSSIVQDVVFGNVVIASPISASSQILQSFYNSKIQIAKEYDINNFNSLYKKFPSWLLEAEENEETKHLKQIVQIFSSYFDDLYNKIKEFSKYKHIKNNQDIQKIYPFYDKILTSTGFDVTELFNNLNIVEKYSSRTEENLFDQDIQKTKNAILQNIYNNLSFILKSKGTEKSIRSFLRSYGVNDDLVRINLYADRGQFEITDNFKETVIKKKTLTLKGDKSVFLSSSAITMPQTDDEGKFTLEASFAFPPSLFNFVENTSSVMGLFITNTGIFETSSAKLQMYVSVEKNTDGFRFCFRTGSSQQLVGSSSLYKNLYDNTIWNLALSMYPNVDDTTSAGGIYNYIVNLRGVNTYKENDPSFEISTTSSFSVGDSFYSGDGRYFIGARKQNLTGSSLQNSYAKFLYCNFWSTYLSDNELLIHNKDLSNYGLE
jgi:hypothetical protein